MKKKIVVVMPAYNAAETLRRTFDDIPTGYVDDIILVDDNSTDDTVAQAAARGVRICRGPAGRARQMNQGASLARGAYYLFLHADSRLPVCFERVIRRVLGDAAVAAGARRQSRRPVTSARRMAPAASCGCPAGCTDTPVPSGR